MKKEYITPEVLVCATKSDAILAGGSIPTEGEGETEDNFSKQHQGTWGNVWDDEEIEKEE